MKIHDIDENLSLYNQIYPSHKNVLPWWKFKDEFSLLINFYPYGKLFFIMSAWWNFFTLIKIHHFMIFFHFDENLSLFQIFIYLMKIHRLEKKFITMMEIIHFDENLPLLWKFIILMKIYHFDENYFWNIFLMNIDYVRENLSILFFSLMNYDPFVNFNQSYTASQLWIFITIIYFNPNPNLHYSDEFPQG